jgi:hypothetical protein
MPWFFFDVADGEQFARDDEGDELPGWQEVRERATSILTEISNVNLAGDDRREFAVRGRHDDAGDHLEPIVSDTSSISWQIFKAL